MGGGWSDEGAGNEFDGLLVARVFNPWPRYSAAISFSNFPFASLLADLAGVPANVLEYQDHGLETRATNCPCR